MEHLPKQLRQSLTGPLTVANFARLVRAADSWMLEIGPACLPIVNAIDYIDGESFCESARQRRYASHPCWLCPLGRCKPIVSDQIKCPRTDSGWGR